MIPSISPICYVVLFVTELTLANHTSHFKSPLIDNIMKTSTLLYDQHLYTFGTELDSSSEPHSYRNSFWKYDLRKDTTTRELHDRTIRQDVGFPSRVVPNLFTFGRGANLPHILSMAQVDTSALNRNLSEDTDPFYSFDQNNNTWKSNVELILRGPEIRSGASIVMTSDKTKVLVFGGFIIHPSDSEIIMSQQLSIFSVSDLIWKDHTTKSIEKEVGAFSYHSATLVDDRYMVILGGFSSPKLSLPISDRTDLTEINKLKRNSLSVITIFDLAKNQWETKNASLSREIHKFGHTATYIPSKKGIAVVGGTDSISGEPEPTSEFLFLSTETWDWEIKSLLEPSGQPKELGRAWHAAELVGDQLFLLHGVHNPSTNVLICVIDVNSWTFTKNLIASKPNSLLTPVDDSADDNLLKTVLIILGSVIPFLLLLGAGLWYFYRRNRKEVKFSAPKFHLEHLWADHKDDKGYNEKGLWLSTQIHGKDSFSNSLWDLNSQYAYSTRLSISHLADPNHENLPSIMNQVPPSTTSDESKRRREPKLHPNLDLNYHNYPLLTKKMDLCLSTQNSITQIDCPTLNPTAIFNKPTFHSDDDTVIPPPPVASSHSTRSTIIESSTNPSLHNSITSYPNVLNTSS